MGQCRIAQSAIAGCLLLLCLYCSCSRRAQTAAAPQALSAWPPVPEPYYNTYSADRFRLGEMLFFDKRLSSGTAVSCASCHKPELAFADKVAVSAGAAGSSFGFRNSPTLLNIGYAPYLMAEGGVPSLEHFSVAPLQDHAEMNQNLKTSLARIAQDTAYLRLFRTAYDTLPSIKYMARALAVYQRYLLSSGSRYDAFLQGRTNALSEKEKRGMTLFYSAATGCGECHSGFLFSDFGFYDIGLETKDNDPGKWRLSGKEEDRNRFKTPMLRNVARTAPYMHDGRFATLEQVMQHYNSGGHNTPNRDPRIKPLQLDASGMEDLIAFMQSLNDTLPYKKSISLNTEK